MSQNKQKNSNGESQTEKALRDDIIIKLYKGDRLKIFDICNLFQISSATLYSLCKKKRIQSRTGSQHSLKQKHANGVTEKDAFLAKDLYKRLRYILEKKIDSITKTPETDKDILKDLEKIFSLVTRLEAVEEIGDGNARISTTQTFNTHRTEITRKLSRLREHLIRK